MSYPFYYDQPKVAPENCSEIVIQASCKMRVEAQFNALFACVPNGTNIASQVGRRKAKREGMKKGFPDAIIIGGGPNAGKIVFAEFKAKKSLSPEQREVLSELQDRGFHVGVFRSQDTLVAKMKDWGWQ